MSQGTLFIFPTSPRSNWLGHLVKHLNLDISVVACTENEEFSKLFPLHKAPAFIDSNGFKLTEVIAIIQYFIALSSKQYLSGKTIQDQAEVTRWLSFINQDILDNWGSYVFAAKTEEDKAKFSSALAKQIKYIDDELSTRSWLATPGYITVADEYLFSWYNALGAVVGGIGSSQYPHLAKWHEEVAIKDEVAIALSKK